MSETEPDGQQRDEPIRVRWVDVRALVGDDGELERWPDGTVVLVDGTLQPEDFTGDERAIDRAWKPRGE